jgi:hypothetical protein
MTSLLRAVAVALLLAAPAGPVLAQPNSKPLPEPAAMGVAPIYHYPSTPYVVGYTPGTYVTVYPAYRPVVIAGPHGAYETYVPTAPVVAGPTWALTPVARPYAAGSYPWGASGPVFGRYSWDYTGTIGAGAWWPHSPYSAQYPTLTGRVWMGYGW